MCDGLTGSAAHVDAYIETLWLEFLLQLALHPDEHRMHRDVIRLCQLEVIRHVTPWDYQGMTPADRILVMNHNDEIIGCDDPPIWYVTEWTAHLAHPALYAPACIYRAIHKVPLPAP
jgi:hypothetical protein